MNEIIENEKFVIADMIYDAGGVQVMLDSEVSANKCYRKEIFYE